MHIYTLQGIEKKNGIKAKKDKSKQDENFVKQKSISDYS